MNFLSPQWTLLTGIILSFFFQGHVIQDHAKKLSSKLLQLSVILLGASLNFNAVLNQGTEGVLITFISLLVVFFLGYLGRKALKVDYQQGTLITMGTAICGGSAIGALSPVIKAETMAITVAIGVVFLLNALAVFIFPFTGELFQLTQEQFGLWAALAIHDTSSVVAASAIYGSKALEIATTVKLIRALWIIPITLFFSFYTKGATKGKISIPWFIFGFLILSLIFTFIEIPLSVKTNVTDLAKMGFAVTLFLIGLTFDFKKIKAVGIRPLLLGIGLWIIVSLLSLVLIKLYV
ncbi:MAG TPA: putative sulfate exporter family transporter [Bacteriovoracaceae bacterium]|nr:putative sulfate exporter family transporter [Bacteriovoracaceae bacterium]